MEFKTEMISRRRWKKRLAFFGFAILLALAVLLGISLGSTNISFAVVCKVLANNLLPFDVLNSYELTDADNTIVWLIRTPRVFVAAIVGASLAIAGAQMQGLFKNPLASPDIAGTSGGAALGAVIAIALGLATRSLYYVPIFAFLGALAAILAVYIIATSRGKTPIATLLLTGVALTALLGAATSLIISLNVVSYQVTQEILFWMMGGLDSRTWTHVWLILPFFMIGLVVSFVLTRELDLMLLGEEAAASLGVETEFVKRIALACAAILTGAAVAVSGMIGFVGLVIPHIARLLVGAKHRSLIPASALLGAAFLILADLLSRLVIRPEEIRLGIVTAILGAPFFLYLLLKNRRAAGVL